MTLRHRLEPLLLAMAVAFSRFGFRSHQLYDLDSVNFALAMGHFDPCLNQALFCSLSCAALRLLHAQSRDAQESCGPCRTCAYPARLGSTDAAGKRRLCCLLQCPILTLAACALQ